MSATVTQAQPSPGAERHFPAYKVWVASLVLVLAIGVAAMTQVLLKGLQVTALSDRVPWGLWITLDLSMIALGAGAFTFSAAVYLFRIKELEALARPAVFIGLLGYTSAMLALAMDIGRPDRFWHPLVYWNVHSVLWEITWCVVLYSTVLFMEVLAVVGNGNAGERWPWLRRLGHRLHRLTPFLALIGMALSLLHQSSLGATYSVLSGRAIWFKPSLPVMFIVSAVAGGMALTVLATMVVSRLSGRRIVTEAVIGRATRIIGFITLGYLYMKLWDWAATTYYSNTPATADVMQRLDATTPYNNTFWGIEILIGGLIPAIILLAPGLLRRKEVVMLALGLIAAGVVVNRWNITLSGLVAPPHWSPGVLGNVAAVSYFPSPVEIAVGLGILAYALLGFTLGVRHLSIYPNIPARGATPLGVGVGDPPVLPPTPPAS